MENRELSLVKRRALNSKPGSGSGTLDPLGNGDWFKMMRDNVDAVVRVFGP